MNNLFVPVHHSVFMYLQELKNSNLNNPINHIYFTTYGFKGLCVNYKLSFEEFEDNRYPNRYNIPDNILYVRYTGKSNFYMVDPKKYYGYYEKEYQGHQAYILYTPNYDIPAKVDKYPYYIKGCDIKYAIKHTSKAQKDLNGLIIFIEDYRKELALLTLSRSPIEFMNNLNTVLSNREKNYNYLIRYYDQALVFDKKKKYLY